jgi:hypothetical protein
MLKRLIAFFTRKKIPIPKLNLVSPKELENYRKPVLTPTQAKRLFNMLHATLVSHTVNESDTLAKYLFTYCQLPSGVYDTDKVITTANYLLKQIWYADGKFHCYDKALTATYLKFRGIPK